MRKIRISWAFALIIIFATPVLFWGCSSDEDFEGPETVNTNANKTGEHPEAGRLEMPKLKGGVVNLFLVKRLSTGAVNLCIEWDIAKKAQRWTAFRWDNSYIDQRFARTEAWSEDYDIPELYRTNQSYYSGSGYSRGHICASADRRNTLEANRQTFLYSNIQPQLDSFNCGIWENLEMKIRSWNNNAFRDTLYVVKGGTIDRPSDILEYVRKDTDWQLLVPKYFFMAILCKNKSQTNEGYKAIGFYLEHRSFYEDEQNLKPYIVSIDRLEELTGIDFFCNLPDAIENQVEASLTPTAWGFQ